MEQLTNVEKIQKAKKEGKWPANSLIIELSMDRWLLAGPTGNGSSWSIWLFEPSGYWNYQIVKNKTLTEVVKICTKVLKNIHNYKSTSRRKDIKLVKGTLNKNNQKTYDPDNNKQERKLPRTRRSSTRTGTPRTPDTQHTSTGRSNRSIQPRENKSPEMRSRVRKGVRTRSGESNLPARKTQSRRNPR